MEEGGETQGWKVWSSEMAGLVGVASGGEDLPETRDGLVV